MSKIECPIKPTPPGNSLGRAKGPCHNCSESDLECDGQRPRCFVCMQKQIPCGGYKLELSWQSGIAARGNLRGFKYPVNQVSVSSVTATSRKSISETSVSKGGKWKAPKYKFVNERAAKRRRGRDEVGRNRFDSRIAAVPTPDLSTTVGGTSPTTTQINQLLQQSFADLSHAITPSYGCSKPIQPDMNLPFIYSQPLIFKEDGMMAFPGTPSVEADPPVLKPYEAQVSILDCFSPSAMNSNTTTDDYSDFEPALYSPVMFGSLADKFYGVLAQYDQNICVIPLTSDCKLNPFRIRKENSSGSQFLLHAILATSFYHLTRNSPDAPSSDLMDRHRTTAFHLFSKALGNHFTRNQGVAFLDTALLLMYLDSAQSANGMFNVHLEGVRSIIDMAGGADVLIPKIPKLRAQLAMFIWCDTTIAIISREAPTLPVSYLEGILRHGRGDGWDYFHLSGCREEYVIAMVKLAKLAMQNEKAEEMEWLAFDASAVDEVEEVIKECSSSPPIYDDAADEEAIEIAQDRYHCDEAWKNGLMLYIARVFRWKRTGPVPGKVRYMARIILDHARSIRRSSTIQKQLLLPVFLAAAEIQSEDYRDFARDYCKWWTISCGFKMFADVSSYLEDIWKEQDNSGRPGTWWATIIDLRKKDSQQPKVPQILMG